MNRDQALARARDLKTSLLDHGVAQVSIELVVGRGSPGWGDDHFIGSMGHHIVSYQSQGPTSHLKLVKDGRSDLPGPLCNGYGGWDEVARIVCMGWANHAGMGGPWTTPSGVVPKNGGRPYWFGWEFEGGINESEWTDSFRVFMARCLAGTLDWLGVDEESHIEHKTWAPGRKSDRLGYTLNRARREIREEMDVALTRQSKADDGLETLAPAYENAVASGMFTEFTQPGGVTYNDEFAAFLQRIGLQPGARLWTKKQITAMIASAAGGGAGTALVIEEIIKRLSG